MKTSAAKGKAVDPRQMALPGILASCSPVVPAKLEWTRPRHAAPDLAHERGGTKSFCTTTYGHGNRSCYCLAPWRKAADSRGEVAEQWRLDRVRRDERQDVAPPNEEARRLADRALTTLHGSPSTNLHCGAGGRRNEFTLPSERTRRRQSCNFHKSTEANI